MDNQAEFYIEKIDGLSNYNLWAQYQDTYFAIGTLFYGDPTCGTDWSVSDMRRAVTYKADEINDELESPLIKITQEQAQSLLQLKIPREVIKSIDEILKIK